MNSQDRIIKNYPLTSKVNCALNCYLLDNKRYLVFWDETITKQSITKILESLGNNTKGSDFSQWKTLIVVGKTSESFKKEELVYFDNVSTFVVFYLVNEHTNEVYKNESWIFTLGLNYKKYIKKIDRILTTDDLH